MFHRLLGLGSHSATKSGGGDEMAPVVGGPLTPTELLMALHTMDPAKCDMKSIIKVTRATRLVRS